MRKLYPVIFIAIVLSLTGLYTSNDANYLSIFKDPQNLPIEVTGFKVHRVAHAGGGIDNKTYTNSYEALNSNLEKGFRYFELDFLFTKDDKLVCLHDWGDNFTRSFGFRTDKKVTLKEFERLVDEKSKFTLCTLDGLAAWMTGNPSAYVVTDVKENNLKALTMIYKALPDAKRRVIPQIYNPKNFDSIAALGFEQIIWTLYLFDGTNHQVLDWVEEFHKPIAITMSKHRAESTLPKELKKRHIPTYVHTVNSTLEMQRYTTMFSITEIYTDFLQPYGRSFDR